MQSSPSPSQVPEFVCARVDGHREAEYPFTLWGCPAYHPQSETPACPHGQSLGLGPEVGTGD